MDEEVEGEMAPALEAERFTGWNGVNRAVNSSFSFPGRPNKQMCLNLEEEEEEEEGATRMD